MGFYLALDIGGTKADYVLADETRVLARVRSGTIKRMRTDAVTATANLEGALAELTALSGVALSAVTRTCVGTAGETVSLVTDFLREQLGRRVAGELILLGDVEIALDAAFPGSPGLLVMAGTGSNVAARMSDGTLLGAGGWGPALADQGSGHRIGLEGLRAGFLARDEGRPTGLLDEVMMYWKLASLDELIGYGNSIPSPDFSKLTEVVLRLALGGDEVAAAVLRKEGEDLGYLVRLVVRRMMAAGEKTLPAIAFTGSILEKVAPVRAALVARVRAEFVAISVMDGVIDPIDGALWRARKG